MARPCLKENGPCAQFVGRGGEESERSQIGVFPNQGFQALSLNDDVVDIVAGQALRYRLVGHMLAEAPAAGDVGGDPQRRMAIVFVGDALEHLGDVGRTRVAVAHEEDRHRVVGRSLVEQVRIFRWPVVGHQQKDDQGEADDGDGDTDRIEFHGTTRRSRCQIIIVSRREEKAVAGTSSRIRALSVIIGSR